MSKTKGNPLPGDSAGPVVSLPFPVAPERKGLAAIMEELLVSGGFSREELAKFQSAIGQRLGGRQGQAE